MNQGILWTFGPFRLEPVNAVLYRDRDPISLRPRSFSVLCHLVGHTGELVTKEQLLDAVWPSRYVSEGVLKVCINEIRAALGDDHKAPRYLETVARRGYRFVADVSTRLQHAPAVVEPAAAVPSHPDGGEQRDRCWVGREPHLAQLLDALEQAEQGNRRTVFVAGEAGMGKTTLVRMFLDRATQWQPTILHCRCVERFGTEEAFLPVIEALVKRCRGSDGDRLKALLSRHAPTWLAQMPWVLTPEEAEQVRHEAFGSSRQRLLLEICEALERLSEQRPLVVALDDLQWSDGATLDFLGLLARRRDRAKLLIVATYRPSDVGDCGAPLGHLKRELQSRGFSTEFPLTNLTASEVGAYLRRHFPNCHLPQALIDTVFKRSGGHPFFLADLVTYLKERGRCLLFSGRSHLEQAMPDRIRLMVESQIERLSQREQQILEAASVAGGEFTAALLAGVLGYPHLEMESLCEAMAKRAQLLSRASGEDGNGEMPTGHYGLTHAIYRDVLYQRLAPAQRAYLHQRIGESLETSQAVHDTGLAAVLAAHFEHACDYPRAVAYLRQAAKDSARRFANVEAVSYLSRALTVSGRFPASEQAIEQLDLLRCRAEVRKSLGDMQGAALDLGAMLDRARDAGDIAAEVSALKDLSRVYVWLDRRRCLQLAAQAAERSLSLDNRTEQRLARGLSGSWNLYLRGWNSANAEACGEALATARRLGDSRQLCSHLALQAMTENFRSDYRAARGLAEEGMALAERAGDGYLYMVCQYYRMWALLHGGAWDEMQRSLESAISTAEKNGNGMSTRVALLMKAWLQMETADALAALDSCNQAGALLEKDHDPVSLCLHPIVTAQAHLGVGDPSAALQCLEGLERLLEGAGILMDWHFFLPFHHVFAQALLTAGERERVAHQIRALHDKAKLAPERTYLALAHRLMAELAHAHGNLNLAQIELTKASLIAEQADCPLAERRIRRTAAEWQGHQDPLAVGRALPQAPDSGQTTRTSLDDVHNPMKGRSLVGNPVHPGKPEVP